jgi:hypothetical protein
MIGARRLAVPASYAPGVNLADDAILVINFGCCGRTYGYTRGMVIAMHARSWEVAHLGMRKGLAVGDFEELHPGDTALLVGLIRSYCNIVFGCASDHTGSAAGASVQVNDHAILVLAFFCFHD